MKDKGKSKRSGAVPKLPIALLGEATIDPKAFGVVLGDLAGAAARDRRRSDPMSMAMLGYCRFYDIDPKDALEPEEILDMLAFASRIAALFGTLDQLPPLDDPDRLPAIAFAACTARLIERDGHPAFQLLDFLAALDRSEAFGAP